MRVPFQPTETRVYSTPPTRLTFGPARRPCPTCKGTGINPVLKFMVCPKCQGETTVVSA